MGFVLWGSLLGITQHTQFRQSFYSTLIVCLTTSVLGFDCNDINYLCQVLCANETSSLNLKKLDLRVGMHKLSVERSRARYSDLNFVHIKRCISKLTNLESIKLDCLNTDQKLQLYEVSSFLVVSQSLAFCFTGMESNKRITSVLSPIG